MGKPAKVRRPQDGGRECYNASRLAIVMICCKWSEPIGEWIHGWLNLAFI